MNKKETNLELLADRLKQLSAEVEKLKRIDIDAVLTSSRSKSADESRPSKSRSDGKPDWVKDWSRKNASHGPVKTVVKTTDTYHEDTGIIETRTELVEPVVTVSYERNLSTGEVEQRVETSGLPEHLRLDKMHADRPQPVVWDLRPTHDGLVPRGLSEREARQYLAENPGNPLELRDEGPAKPIRKQMTRLNKVWRYRNFRACAHCEAYDTWQTRTDPYADGPRETHAEVWCHSCGAVDFEVADNLPTNVGSWTPPKETSKEAEKRRARQQYRRERTIFSLVESPKTAQELTVWFRTVEKYDGVDFIMLELMLKRMCVEGLVVREVDDRWWEAEDHSVEHPTAGKPQKS